MGKKAKEHRKKIAKRNEGRKLQEKKAQKASQEFLMKLIEQEKQKGLFNNATQPLPNFEMPTLEGTTLGTPNGFQI